MDEQNQTVVAEVSDQGWIIFSWYDFFLYLESSDKSAILPIGEQDQTTPIWVIWNRFNTVSQHLWYRLIEHWLTMINSTLRAFIWIFLIWILYINILYLYSGYMLTGLFLSSFFFLLVGGQSRRERKWVSLPTPEDWTLSATQRQWWNHKHW